MGRRKNYSRHYLTCTKETIHTTEKDQDLYTEKDKTSLKKIEDLNKIHESQNLVL